MNEIMRILAVMFLQREQVADNAKAYGAAIAYRNAFDLLCYALEDNENCISQFDGYDEAKAFIKEHPNLDMWALEDFIKGW
jgi:hypothetical protein